MYTKSYQSKILKKIHYFTLEIKGILITAEVAIP